MRWDEKKKEKYYNSFDIAVNFVIIVIFPCDISVNSAFKFSFSLSVEFNLFSARNLFKILNDRK